ncbi:hypothetical protein D3C71_1308870 [compost metagenome]
MPFTYSGERSEKNFHLSDSGLMFRSNSSRPRSIVPVASTFASGVASLATRARATPWFTAKSATAHCSCTSLSSPNSLATTMEPTLSAARSRSWALKVPLRT